MYQLNIFRRLAVLLGSVVVFSGLHTSGFAQQPTTPPRTPVVPAANVCSALVRAAMQSTNQLCGDTSRNQACYGHILNTASFRNIDGLVFEAQGDKAALDQIQTLHLSPLDLELEQWGVVLMQAQANLPDSLPGQNVTFILFGDVEVNNASGESVEIDARLTTAAQVHIAPGENRAVIANLAEDVALFATGKYFNADGILWVRIGQTLDSQAFGWVLAAVLDTDFDALPDVSPTGETFNPMQAFYFKTGIGQPQCAEAPRDGMIVQTPRGAGKVNFTVNGIDIALGSTAYFNFSEGGDTCISLLEGESDIAAAGGSETVQPGQRSCVALNEDGIAASPPSVPDAFDPAEIGLLTVVLETLPETVDIPVAMPSNTPTSTNTLVSRRATATVPATVTPEPPTSVPPTSAPPPTATNTPRPTRTPSATFTATDVTPTATFTETFTPTEAFTPTDTFTPTETATFTDTFTPTDAFTPTMTASATETFTPTMTFTPTETFTPTPTSTDEMMPPPVANFSMELSAMTITLTDQSSNSPTFVWWTFGDGNEGYGSSLMHTYGYPGSGGVMYYMVNLEVCNSGGCDTTSQELILPNCNYDTNIVHGVSWEPDSTILPTESYTIMRKNPSCEVEGAVGGTVDILGGVSASAFEGQHFFSREVLTSLDCSSYVTTGAGPFSFLVGGVSCLLY